MNVDQHESFISRDIVDSLGNLIFVLCDKLEKSFKIQILSADDRESVHELQAALCGSLHIITQKMEEKSKPFCPRMMELFMRVFNTAGSAVFEEAMLAVGAIANACGSDFIQFMNAIKPVLLVGLTKYQEKEVCANTIGATGDIARSLGKSFANYSEELVGALINAIRSNLAQSVKPSIFVALGDIAVAMEDMFLPLLPVVMEALDYAQSYACQTPINIDDYEIVDLMNDVCDVM